MSKQNLRDHINLIKRKLTTFDGTNEEEDQINDISEDVKALVNFKIDKESQKQTRHTKHKNPIKQIKKVKPNISETQYFKIDDEPETIHQQNDKVIVVSKGVFEVDLSMCLNIYLDIKNEF